MRIRATGSGEDLHLESYDAEELFHEGFRRQNQADCAAAVQFYDRLASEFASSRFLSSALYDAGLCYEALDRFADAQARYDRLIRDLPESPDVKDALFRSGGCAEHLENAAKAEATFTTLLGREDLTPDEHLEAMTRHAAALLALERLDECEAEARRAIAFYRRAEGTQPIETDYFVAQAQYLLGEVLRVEFERIRFTADEAEMRRDLERKSRLLLDAQAEYILAIRTTNPHWAAASGYRIGEIFRNFYDHIMAAPVPASLDAEQREIYFEELRNQIRPLVQKAIRVWERTILMSERTGVHNEWVERTNADLESVRRMLVDGGSAPSPATEHAPPPAQPPAPARQQDPGPVG
jgi:tetratricopeptide (TPR) repeat protein